MLRESKHSLTHSLTHSRTHSLTHLLNHSRTHALPLSLTHALTYSLTHAPRRKWYRLPAAARCLRTRQTRRSSFSPSWKGMKLLTRTVCAVKTKLHIRHPRTVHAERNRRARAHDFEVAEQGCSVQDDEGRCEMRERWRGGGGVGGEVAHLQAFGGQSNNSKRGLCVAQ